MNKIITAINTMISNENSINSVIQGYSDNEIFFIYNEKYKWSISSNDHNIIYLHYYPGSQNIEELSRMSDVEWSEFKQLVSYNSNELGTNEALASLNELRTIVQGKLFGMDDVLNEIIQTIPF